MKIENAMQSVPATPSPKTTNSQNTQSGKSNLALASRRTFLKLAAALSGAIAVPYFVPATSLGFGGSVAPSDRIVMGAIGCGGKGRHNTGEFLKDQRVQFVAACDVDSRHSLQCAELVNGHYKNENCLQFSDFRELIARNDIDAIHVSTPDHWHAVASVRAMDSGKDVYCEKPLANSFGESKAIRDATARTGRVLQCGSHERSNNNCRFAAELVRNGRIGKLETIRIQMPCEQDHHQQAKAFKTAPVKESVPEQLDWDMWQGHTQPTEYWEKGCHFWWRFILKYGGGEMTDRGAHIIDIAQLALDMDNSGPTEFEAQGSQTEGSPYDTFWDYSFTNTYANGVKMIGESAGERGLKFEGSDGWLFVAIHGGKLTASNPEILPENVRSGGNIEVDQTEQDFQVQLGRSPGHHENFIDCVINRKQPKATAEIGHRTATICHLNNIAMKIGRTIRWDPNDEAVVNDIEAGKLLLPAMRSPWQV